MSVNIDDLVAAGDVEIQHRITRWDVSWGRPHFAVTYKRLMLAKMPVFYWSMEASGEASAPYSRNWGSAGRDYDLVYAGVDDLEWASGQADPTDDACDFGNAGYAEALLDSDQGDLALGYTLVAWFKPGGTLEDDRVDGILCRQTVPGVGGLCSVHLEGYAGSNRLALHFNGDSLYVAASTAPVGGDRWHCLTIVVEPGGVAQHPDRPVSVDNPKTWLAQNPMRVYVDGVSVYDASTIRNEPEWDDAGKWLVGATQTIGGIGCLFDGIVDEVGVFPLPMNEYTVQQLYVVGQAASYLEPDEDFDNDIVGSYLDQRGYRDVVIGDGPVNYWTFDTILTGTGDEYKYCEDQAGDADYERNLSVARSAGQWSEDRIVDTVILSANYKNGEVGKALILDGDSGRQAKVLAREDSNYLEAREMSVEFWFNSRGFSSHFDGLIGFPYQYDERGFCCSFSSKTLRAYWSFSGVDESSRFLTTAYTINLLKEEWYHVVATLDRTGEARLYINGQVIAADSWGSTYAYQSPAVGDLIMGGTGVDPNNTRPPYWMDEVALYDVPLTAAQVYNHYWTGKLGPFAKVELTGGDPLQDPSPFIVGTNEYSELANEQDITAYVESFSVDDDMKQLISTASLTVYEAWGAQQINDKLNANTYVRIEQRYLSQSIGADSGWTPLGDFLCEGPIGSSYQASGQRTYTVALKGLTKLLGLDLAHTPIEPDRLLVRKRKLDVNTATVEYSKFHMSRDPANPSVDDVLENWAEFPSTKIWVTDFKNLDAEDEGGVDDPKEVIRIKGSEGAVQVLGGEGAVVIDNTYLMDKISEDGLGNPDTIMAEFYRYATSKDKCVTTLTGLSVVRNRWRIGLDRQAALIDGMSFLVRSGQAKGKLWKLVGTGYNRILDGACEVASDTVLGNEGDYDGDWTLESSFDGAPVPPGGWAYRAEGDASDDVEFKYAVFPLEAEAPPSSVDWDDASRIAGVRVTVTRRVRAIGSAAAAKPQMVKDIGIKLRLGDLETTQTAKTSWWENSVDWYTVVYGSDTQPLGVNWTWSDVKDALSDAQVLYSIELHNIIHGGVNAATAEVSKVVVELFVEDLGVVTLFDVHGYPVHPEYEGLAVGDSVQIGDYNSVEDALRKVLYRCGFQENDSTKPFYFELDTASATLAPCVPPTRPTIGEQTSHVELCEEIVKYAPPNYRLYVDANGVTRGRLVGFLTGVEPSHRIVGRIDVNEDRGDYGVATRLIVEGQGPDTFNLALNVEAGGTAACRAYVLTGYANPNKQPETDDDYGIAKTQEEADAIWRQVFNGNPKQPVPSTRNRWKDRYGVILAKEGPPSKVKRWDFEDLPLCVVDLGRSETGTPVEIEALEFTWMNHYLEGNAIAQSMIVHYMTEQAYEAEFGRCLSSEPDGDDTTYMPPASSRAWDLLVDEIALTEGNMTVESADFEGGQPAQVRFLKFTCGQAHYRFPIKINSGDEDAAIRVTIAEIKAWSSRRIVASAELGTSGLFASGDFKELATRLRRRTDYLEKNLYLNDYAKAKTFAQQELQERYVDFTPLAVTAFAPTAEVGEVVYLVHPETRVGKNYLVVASSRDSTGVAKIQVLNYDLPT